MRERVRRVDRSLGASSLAVVGAIAGDRRASRARPARTPPRRPPPVASTGAGRCRRRSWYWTMAVSPSDPNALVLGDERAASTARPTAARPGSRPARRASTRRASCRSATRSTPAASHATPTTSPVVRTGATARRRERRRASSPSSTDGGKTWKVLHPSGPAERGAAGARDRPGEQQDALRAAHERQALPLDRRRRSRSSSSSAKLGIPPWAIAITKGGHFVGGDMDTGAYSSANGTTWKKTPFTDSRGGKMVMEYAVAADRLDEGADDELRDRDLDRRRQDLAHGAQVDHDVRAGRLLGRPSRTSPTRSASTARSGAPTTAARPGRRSK